MLIITRKITDSFEIRTPEGKIIKVIYLKCSKSKQIRLGVVADSDVIIERHNRYAEGGTQDESNSQEDTGNR